MGQIIQWAHFQNHTVGPKFEVTPLVRGLIFAKSCIIKYDVCIYIGGTLEMAISNNRLSGFQLEEKDLINLLFQVLQGIKYIHGNNLVHLDIKPGNILVHKVQVKSGTDAPDFQYFYKIGMYRLLCIAFHRH